jgi:small subunit ribosomal protein S2
MPFVDGRWVGGTFTNFKEIRRRIDKFEKLQDEREKGELSKYTKKERLLIDREIDRLAHLFGGIVSVKEMPKALFVIDPKAEKNAVAEALQMNVPVIALAGSDCDISDIAYPIVGNDASQESIRFFANEIAKAYEEGKTSAKPVETK